MNRSLLTASLLASALACAHTPTVSPVQVHSAAPVQRAEPAGPAKPAQGSAPTAPGAPRDSASPTPSSAASTPPAPAPAPQQFACPMHKDVTSKAAGRCSKCGMALEPSAASVPPFAAQR